VLEKAGRYFFLLASSLCCLDGHAQAVANLNYAQALEQVSEQPVAVNSVPVFNVREGYGAYIVPGVVVLIMQQTLLMAIALMFGTWFERDGLPVSADLHSYFGMLSAYASVAVLNCLYFFGFVLWWQDYPRGGNFAGMLVFILLYSYTVAAFGMMLGMLFSDEGAKRSAAAGDQPACHVSGRACLAGRGTAAGAAILPVVDPIHSGHSGLYRAESARRELVRGVH
jgi:hypothetical protein